MKKQILTLFLIFLLFPSIAVASGHGHHKAVKKGILLVAFGSSIPEAQVSFENIDKRVKKEFANIPVQWAFTSSIIRNKLAKQGKQLDSVAVALAKMMDQGFTHVAVQSLHTIRGEEFNDLLHTAYAFNNMAGGIEKIMIGSPLLSSHQDMEAVTHAIIENIPAKRKKNEAVVLMGHGTPHPSNAFYAALMFHLQRKDANIFVGTVEGSPTIDDIATMLKEKKIKKVHLIPFMSVAGDHARNDMAGEEDDSWKSILEKQGINCEVVLKGTAEYDNMIDIWVGHLKDVMAHF
ncbi:sirohydrochlorin cobaltochelatase [Desulfobacula toluolica]|uniref:CbiK: sirohydrochlorin cobaltochelatase n=1 Tax=Desulfobacula toluolica (strain DSM 7467 / Tol2) TaxID=651182 RepID=K0NJE0_DESTT|nr:sirohydrochlorin cobaltochelatase [Desulfobacula toluolica]CCK81576.1 CbiK: sirohydrochlorin cobaltochelatase [Desulfobacula toluolica Tol2]